MHLSAWGSSSISAELNAPASEDNLLTVTTSQDCSPAESSKDLAITPRFLHSWKFFELIV
jgi:hypothetical protein